MSTELSLVAFGSPNGDDRIAWDVVDALSSFKFSAPLKIVKCDRHPLDFWGKLTAHSQVVILDAILVQHRQTAPDIGRLHRFKLIDGVCELSSSNLLANSSHSIDSLTSLQLGQILGELPNPLMIWGIEIARALENYELSPALSRKRSFVTNTIRENIESEIINVTEKNIRSLC